MNPLKLFLFFCLVWVPVGTEGSQKAEGGRLKAESLGSEVRILATGRSMEPVWRAGDWLAVDSRWKLGDRVFPLRPGMDIVFDLKDGRRIAHRIVRVRGNWLVTKGVNNAREDPFFVHRSRVVGRVASVERRAKSAEERVTEIFGNQRKETYATTK